MSDALGASSKATSAIVLPAGVMAETVDVFIERYGFRVSRVFPADNPQTIELVGWGLSVVLDVQAQASGVILRLPEAAAPEPNLAAEIAPNGIRIEWGSTSLPDIWKPILPATQRVAAEEEATWHVGRAGLRYRDLLPERMGGGIIASQIRLLEGGPVSDYVHFHHVTFQMIYCYAGWVKVVYEDQGEPFFMREGDCVLQPPGIRHRVLSSSAGAEVIELACPGSHETFGDLTMELPNGEARPSFNYGGQRFVWHQAEQAELKADKAQGWRSRDFGFIHATDGLAEAGVYVASPGAEAAHPTPDGVFHFVFVLRGQIKTEDPEIGTLDVGESAVFYPGRAQVWQPSALTGCTLLYVRLLRQPNTQQPVLEERPR